MQKLAWKSYVRSQLFNQRNRSHGNSFLSGISAHACVKKKVALRRIDVLYAESVRLTCKFVCDTLLSGSHRRLRGKLLAMRLLPRTWMRYREGWDIGWKMVYWKDMQRADVEENCFWSGRDIHRFPIPMTCQTQETEVVGRVQSESSELNNHAAAPLGWGEVMWRERQGCGRGKSAPFSAGAGISACTASSHGAEAGTVLRNSCPRTSAHSAAALPKHVTDSETICLQLSSAPPSP